MHHLPLDSIESPNHSILLELDLRNLIPVVRWDLHPLLVLIHLGSRLLIGYELRLVLRGQLNVELLVVLAVVVVQIGLVLVLWHGRLVGGRILLLWLLLLPRTLQGNVCQSLPFRALIPSTLHFAISIKITGMKPRRNAKGAG